MTQTTLMHHGTPDQTPRSHLLGWGESGPPLQPEECRICGAEPNQGHLATMLGVDETLGILGLLQRGVTVPTLKFGPILDARARSTRTHDL